MSSLPISGTTGPSEKENSINTPNTMGTPANNELENTVSLEDLQTDEQRRILDMIVQVRKCGLDSVLSLPQLVVCGDQSAGKSSVLESLTGIPFPRADNLCTRFATEISLRRANTDSLTIKVNPDATRPATEQAKIKAFEESITNFDDLPRIMNLAMAVMGLSNNDADSSPRAFARDVLSIEISGPSRPQLTLVDIPGLIATSSKGITKADVDMVAEITDYYIEQPRTICLAVVSALNDYSNQRILERVRDVDPEGERTLGIITKPDGLAANSGSETSFIALAKNEDIFFKLGWHVLKNRKFEEKEFSLTERNRSEAKFFRTSNFKVLPPDTVGIDALRRRLSLLLFEHIKKELPQLRDELLDKLDETRAELQKLGTRRSTPEDCKDYLSQLSLNFWEICKAAVDGHYEGPYFQGKFEREFSLKSPATLCRTRAVIQSMNSRFAQDMRVTGHKFQIDMENDATPAASSEGGVEKTGSKRKSSDKPILMGKKDALKWVESLLIQTRGKELMGNFNPLLIGVLFWEQSSNWGELATSHVEDVFEVCTQFLKNLLQACCPRDVHTRVWAFQIEEELKARYASATKELSLLLDDLKNYPLNYNHYYTDTIAKRRSERQNSLLREAVSSSAFRTYPDSTINIDVNNVIKSYSKKVNPDMDAFTCEEALDCLFAIYKVTQKTFIANVTTQVIERHIVRGIEKIFSPVVVNKLNAEQAEALASEPVAVKRQRAHLEEQVDHLVKGHRIFKSVM